MNDNKLFEEMLNDYLPGMNKAGEVIDAVIIRKGMEYSYLDISSKLEGRIRTSEIEGFEVNDIVSVQVIRSVEEDGFVIVSKKKVDQKRELESYNIDDIVEGTVIKKIKGGYNVRVKNNVAFLPMSLSGSNKDLTGKTFEFLVKEKSNKGITVSRIDLVKKEITNLLESLELNSVVTAKVKQILDFGAILELGPITGLLHISELSWDNVKNIADLLKVGQEIDVKIIELNKEKVKFSLKQLSEDPWNTKREKYSIGQKLSGTIKEILDFGLVIDIEDSGVEGFMHVSDINYRKFFKLNSVFNVGDKIDFAVININDEKQRISLSAKVLLDELWENIDTILVDGDVVEAKIVFNQDYGMFVELDNKLEAFIRRNEYAWNKNELVDYKEGDNVKFKVISIDKENKKISGSIRETVVSPWREAYESFKEGYVIKTFVVNKIESGLLVKLTDRFNGLIPNKELDKEYAINDDITAVIIDTNENKNSMILSVNRILENAEQEELDELMKQYGAER